MFWRFELATPYTYNTVYQWKNIVYYWWSVLFVFSSGITNTNCKSKVNRRLFQIKRKLFNAYGRDHMKWRNTTKQFIGNYQRIVRVCFTILRDQLLELRQAFLLKKSVFKNCYSRINGNQLVNYSTVHM